MGQLLALPWLVEASIRPLIITALLPFGDETLQSSVPEVAGALNG